jgi:hypothetical protein
MDEFGNTFWDTKKLGLDPTKADTDEDGLTDDEEVTLETELASGPGSTPTLEVELAGSPVAHPNVENTDGVGLNDGEEIGKGSEPWVGERFTAGYTLATMADGPNTTKPLEAGELEATNLKGPDSSLVMQPSKKNVPECHHWVCLPDWLDDVHDEVDGDHIYLRIPVTVYAQTNRHDAQPIEYEITMAGVGAEIIDGKTEGVIDPDEGSKVVYLVLELSRRPGLDVTPAGLRYAGQLQVNFENVDETVYSRKSKQDVASEDYQVATDTILAEMAEVLERTQFIYDKGLTFTQVYSKSYTIAMRSGSTKKAIRYALYKLAESELKRRPESAPDFVKAASLRGIAAFEQKVKKTRSENWNETFGDAVARPMGSQIVRAN